MIVDNRKINTLFLLLLTSILIGIYRSYIFTESAAFVLFLLFLINICLKTIKVRTGHIFYQLPFVLQYLFIVYLFIRVEPGVGNGYDIIVEQIFYLLIFSITVVYSFNFKLNLVISVIPLLYLSVFTVKVLFIFEQVKYGANLWSGYVVFLLLPLVLMYPDRGGKKNNIAIMLLVVIFTVFLVLITARIAALSVILFYCFIYILPRLNRKMRSLIFFSLVVLLFLFIKIYSEIQNTGVIKELDNLSLIYFNKTIFSGRQFIWADLIQLIEVNPIFGYCSNCSSILFEATEMKRNLSSHNSFLEVLLRGGSVGLILFVSIFYSIWRTLFACRYDKQVNISAAFLLASLLFMSFGELWFSNLVMCNAIAWMIIGLGYGKARNLIMSKYVPLYIGKSNSIMV